MLPPLAAAAALVLVATPALAQFAGVPVAPARRAQGPLLTPAQVATQRDSVRQEALSDMRAWVDSAAGIVTVTPAPPEPPEPAPSAPAGGQPASPAAPARPPER